MTATNVATGVATISLSIPPEATAVEAARLMKERQIRRVLREELAQEGYSVITAETGQGALGALFGDRLIFVAHGRVIAGVVVIAVRLFVVVSYFAWPLSVSPAAGQPAPKVRFRS